MTCEVTYRLDGVCVYCKRATPISRNTAKPEGIVCGPCRRERKSREEVRAAQRARIMEIEAEMARLLAELGELPYRSDLIRN